MSKTSNDGAEETQRLDKWLWCARFFKSRSIASTMCQGKKVRINRQVVSKAAASVRVGDVLTFPQSRHIRVIKILSLASRRGPASEAQTLYEDLSPPEQSSSHDKEATVAAGESGRVGRPTKRDRRLTDRLRGQD